MAVGVATAFVQPNMLASFQQRPWAVAIVLLAAGRICAARVFRLRGNYGKAFFASCLYLYAMMASGACWIFPYVLPGRATAQGLTAAAAATVDSSLVQTLIWWVPGICIALGYTWIAYHLMPAKFLVADEAEH
jgi:cytochrome bd-type quinol oxidase subunit 2